MTHVHSIFLFFFFNDTATTEIYTLSLHDALPIFAPRLVEIRRIPRRDRHSESCSNRLASVLDFDAIRVPKDRKSTRLNSSHGYISYAVFCLKKKKNTTMHSRYSTDTTVTQWCSLA